MGEASAKLMMNSCLLKKEETDFYLLRQDFPILQQKIHGKPLVYLDSAASSQKPQVVLDALLHYYSKDHANVHRGVHTLSERATVAYENTRERLRDFIQAKYTEELIFVSGATEGINLVAESYGRKFIKKDDEIIVSVMEHHSNIVPWQLLCEKTGARLRVIPMSDTGELDLAAYQDLFNSQTRMVALAHVSNVLGTLNPIKEMIHFAHEKGVPVLIDGAQAFGHLPVDVQDLDCDFYVFSSHKAYGPTGVGVLYGKRDWLERLPPYKGGGDMIETVTFEKSTYNKLPYKFEAGTPNIASVIGLGAAIDYLNKIGIEAIFSHEQSLLAYATEKLQALSGLRLLGEAKQKLGVLSFELENLHPHDLGTILDREGIAIRVGHHCAMPLMARLDVPATARASLGLYNTKEDIDALVEGIAIAKRFFA
jgi:cysteine desulfurase/selenocysteine lyase